MSPLRFLHLADTHIGSQLPASPRTVGHRGNDLVASYHHVVTNALRDSVDFVIHAGDLFDQPQPHGPAVTAACEPLLRLAARGIPVVVAPGNHERSTIPDNLFLQHPNIHIALRPTTFRLRIRGVTIALPTLPCLRREAVATFPEALDESGWYPGCADCSILVVHQAFDGAVCGPNDYRFRAGPDVVARSVLPAGLSYVAAGHIHRHQVLQSPIDGTPIVYAGSTDRITFAERNEPKGCIQATIDAAGRVRHHFVEHAVRPMTVRSIDVTGLSRARLQESIEETLHALPPGALADVRLTGESTPDRLRGMALTQRTRRLRPDVSLRVSMKAIEILPEHTRLRRTAAMGRRAFDLLDAPHRDLDVCPVERLDRLPNRRGVYTLYDRAERLLYVGQAGKVRTRIRAHLRGRQTNAFGDWIERIARVEVRPAESSIEMTLVEAELIRRSRPPFNRALRSTRPGGYLVPQPDALGQLVYAREPDSDKPAFGPYGSEREAARVNDLVCSLVGVALCPPPDSALPLLNPTMPATLCERYYSQCCRGPCAGRIGASDYGRLLAARNAILAGEDDAVLAHLEQQAAETGEGSQRGPWERSLEYARHVFDRAREVRAASRLMGQRLALPGDIWALLQPDRIVFMDGREPDTGTNDYDAQPVASNSATGQRVHCSMVPLYLLAWRWASTQHA